MNQRRSRRAAEERCTEVDLARRAAEGHLRDAKASLAVASADGRAAAARATAAEDRVGHSPHT